MEKIYYNYEKLYYEIIPHLNILKCPCFLFYYLYSNVHVFEHSCEDATGLKSGRHNAGYYYTNCIGFCKYRTYNSFTEYIKTEFFTLQTYYFK